MSSVHCRIGDLEPNRWVSLIRVLGLIGLIAALMPSRIHGEDGKLVILALVSWPFKPLVLLNVYLLLFAPAAIMSLVYLPICAIVYFLNLLHALVLSRNNEELSSFLVKATYYRLKLMMTFSSMTDVLPHLDIYSSEREKFPATFAVQNEATIPRLWILLRMLGLPGIILIPHVLVTFFLLLGYQVALLVQWAITAITGRPNDMLLGYIQHCWRIVPLLEAYAFGVTNRIVNPLLLLPNRTTDLEAAPSGGSWIQGSGGAKIFMNVLVLVLLLLLSGGLYGLFWLARISKLMGDDAFTIIVVSVLGLGLPLSFVYSRYYRRSEALQRMPPSILVELVVMVPILNHIMGPFIVQYNLNNYERARAKGGGDAAA